MAITEVFSDAFLYNKFLLITGTVSATQLPTGSCGMLRFKADPDNNDDFYIGNYDSQPYKLAAGDDTGWCSASNLNHFYYSAISGAADYMFVWYQV